MGTQPFTTEAGILTVENLTEQARPFIGGKGDNLFLLSKEGFPVPSWFIVPTGAFSAFQQQHQIRGELQSILETIDFADQSGVRAASDRIKNLIAGREILEPWRSEILKCYSDLFLKKDGQDAFVAVRSSAIGEDSAGQSFAGQLDTFLFVKGEEQILRSIKGCWASAFSERGLTYRHLNKLELRDIQVAVILQEMVFGEVSGVMFTANPMTGNRGEIVISATFGIGEGLVSGRLSADNFIVDRSTRAIHEEIADKTAQILLDKEKGYGTTEVGVPEELQSKPCLSQELVLAIAEAGERIQTYYGPPQDIEWTLAGGKLFILQARPITNLPEPKAPRGRLTIWDNSNITESYSGVTSPLTFSFARQAYTIVYHQFCEVMGVPPDIIQANNQTYRNMLGLLRGRIYYNLQNWYRVLSLFPGFNYNKAFMEQMMGLKEIVQYQKQDAPVGWYEKYLVELPKLLGLLRRMTYNFRHIDGIVERFQKNFDESYGLYQGRSFREMAPEEIVAAYYELERRLLWNWKAPIMTDFFAMIFYGVLKKLVASWVHDETGSLQNNLLCGQGNIESTEPTKAIMRMALRVRQDPHLSEFLMATPDREIWSALQGTSDERVPSSDVRRPTSDGFKESLDRLRDQVQHYLDRYGYRCMNELKLEEKNLKEDPTFIFTMMKNYLKMPDLSIEAMEEQERQIRLKAEAVVAERLKSSPFRRRIFRWVLENARKHVRNRENMRFARTKIFGLLREMFQALGHHFHAMGALERPEDVFYLNLDEVFGFVEGTATCEKLNDLARLRREEFDRYRREPADDRIPTYGPVYHDNRFYTEFGADEGETGVLKGISCCPGTVEGPVKAILSTSDDMTLNGEILVAERTDPGWVPLYPSASGLLIERGSILSHSAIVARELGLPTIVGIKNLTRHVKTGMRVKMDAREGVVYLNP